MPDPGGVQHPHPDRSTRPDGYRGDCRGHDCTHRPSADRDISAADGNVDCYARAYCDIDRYDDFDLNPNDHADRRAN
jgi:hypothetical protein